MNTNDSIIRTLRLQACENAKGNLAGTLHTFDYPYSTEENSVPKLISDFVNRIEEHEEFGI